MKVIVYLVGNIEKFPKTYSLKENIVSRGTCRLLSHPPNEGDIMADHLGGRSVQAWATSATD